MDSAPACAQADGIAPPRELPLATVVFSAAGRPICKTLEWNKENQKLRQLDPTLGKLYRVHEVPGPVTLARRAEVRLKLVDKQDGALICGVLRPEFLSELEPAGATFKAREYHTRSLKTFCDAKLPFFVADIENLDARKFDPDFDARNGVRSAHDVLRDVLDSIGADFLIADHLIHASSRFGLVNHHEFRGHVEWQLKSPLSLAEQKLLAHWLNSQCSERGLPGIFDEAVYDAARFLFTSRPRIVRADMGGKRNRYIDLDLDELRSAGINTAFERVSLHSAGAPLIELPDDLANEIADTSPAPSRSKSPRARSRTSVSRQPKNDQTLAGHAFRLAQISKIEDGKTHNPVRDIIASISAERRGRWPQICARYLKLVVQQIEQTSPDIERRDQRINDHAQLHLWLQGCSDARAKFDADNEPHKKIVFDLKTRVRPVLDDVPTARSKLASEMERVVNESLAYDPTKLVGTGLIQQRERPLFTVFDAAPGLGKSFAALEALDPALYGGKKVIFITPTEKLGDAIYGDRVSQLKRVLQDRGVSDIEEIALDLKKHLNVIKGRARLCIDKDGFGADAAQLEACGISPARVCAVCTKRADCGYAKQDKALARDTFMMHAHLPTLIRKISEDETIGLLVIDESIVPTLTDLPPCGSRLSLSQLEREARRAKASSRKRKDGKAAGRIEITADLIASLGTVNKILNGAKIAANGVGRIYAASLSPLKTLRSIKHAEGQSLSRRAIDEAISEVSNWGYGAREALQKAIEERAKRRAAGQTARDLAVEVNDLKVTIECAAFYGVILEAFRGTIDNPARAEETDTVMGSWLFEHAGEIHVHAQVHSRLPARLASVPIIALDGTANIGAVQAIVGNSHRLDVIATPAAPPPGSYHIVQYPDAPYGKAKFVDTKNMKSKKALTQIWKTICVEAARDYGEPTCRRKDGSRIDVLVACQLAVETELNKLGLPPNVQTIHFNAERGVNAYKDVSCGIVIGRSMLKTPELEERAEALHYDDHRVKTIHGSGDQKLTTGHRWLSMADGSRVRIPVECHPDPHVAALVRSQVDDEPKQAAHRLRIYSCTAQNPARLIVFGQCDVGLPVHEIGRFVDSSRDVADFMLARGVVVLDRKYIVIAHKNWVGRSDRSERELTDAIGRLENLTNSPSRTAIPISSILIESAVCEPNLSGFALVTIKHPNVRYRGRVLINQTRHPDIATIVAETFGLETRVINSTLPQEPAVSSATELALSLSGATNRKRGRPKHENPSEEAQWQRDYRERQNAALQPSSTRRSLQHEIPDKHPRDVHHTLAQSHGAAKTGPSAARYRPSAHPEPDTGNAAAARAPRKTKRESGCGHG